MAQHTINLNPTTTELPEGYENVTIVDGAYTIVTTAAAIRSAGELATALNHKVKAVKFIRAFSGGDLRTAKMIVDAAQHLGLVQINVLQPEPTKLEGTTMLGELLRRKLAEYPSVEVEVDDAHECQCPVCVAERAAG